MLGAFFDPLKLSGRHKHNLEVLAWVTETYEHPVSFGRISRKPPHRPMFAPVEG